MHNVWHSRLQWYNNLVIIDHGRLLNLILRRMKKYCKKYIRRKPITKSDGKIAFFTIITVWKVFLLHLFGVNHFSFFNRSKSASNFAFYNTHIKILLHKIVLLLFANFEAKRGLNSSEKRKTYFIKVFYIAFLFAWISDLRAFILSKRSKLLHFSYFWACRVDPPLTPKGWKIAKNIFTSNSQASRE